LLLSSCAIKVDGIRQQPKRSKLILLIIDLGFKDVRADVDITELVWDEMNKEVNGPTPQFMIVAKK